MFLLLIKSEFKGIFAAAVFCQTAAKCGFPRVSFNDGATLPEGTEFTQQKDCLAGSRDAGIDQLPLQHDVHLVGKRHDHDRIFRTL